MSGVAQQKSRIGLLRLGQIVKVLDLAWLGLSAHSLLFDLCS